MTIDEAREQLSAYLDGELAADARGAVERALEAHPELRAELHALRRTAALVRSMPREPAPAGLADRVVAAIEADAPAPAPPRRWRARWRPLAAAAAACLVVGLAALLATRSQPPRPKAHTHHTTPASKATAHRDQPDGAFDREFHAKPEAERLADLKKDAAPGHEDKLLLPKRPAPAAAPLGEGMAPGAPPKPSVTRVAERPPRTGGAAPAAGAAGKAREVRAAIARLPSKKAEWAKRKGQLAAGRGGALVALQTAKLAERLDRATEEQEEAPAAANGELIAAIRQSHPANAFAARARRKRGERHGAGAAPKPHAGVPPRPAPARTPAEPAADRVALAKGRGRAGPPALEWTLTYHDLHQCLADVRRALGEANVAFAIQPLGSGRFAVEADMAAGEAAALLARLSGALPPPHKKAPEHKRVAAEGGMPADDGRGGLQGRGQVHLVLRFSPAFGAAPPEIGDQGPRKPQSP